MGQCPDDAGEVRSSRTNMADQGGQQVSFQFQVGLVRDRIVVDISELTLKTLKGLADKFISEKFPEHGVTRLKERLMLFRHEYAAENILHMINAVSEIREDTIVEVIINTQPLGDEDVEIRPHSLSIHSYKTPTFCDFCGEMLFGMFKQGLKCEFCGMNFHKRCVFKIPNDCSHKKKRRSNSSLGPTSSIGAVSLDSSNLLIPPGREGSVSPGSSKREKSVSSVHGRPPWVDVQMAGRLKIPHTFVLHTYAMPTKCHFCNKLLVGMFKQGVQCKDCRFNAHKKCSERAPGDCTGEVPFCPGEVVTSDGPGDFDDHGDESDDDGHSGESPEMDESSVVTPLNFEAHITAQSTISNIPVQRLVQSVKQTKRVGNKTLKEGWMIHFTNENSMRKRHYWRLDSKCITMFQSDTGTKYYKEIPLSEILTVDSAKKKTGEIMHCFELRTANVDFFIGEDSTSGASPSADQVNSWEEAIRQALMPVQSGETAATPAPSKHSSSPAKEPPASASGKEKDISQSYQIFPDEVLGSGQFGIVNGGVHRISGKNVAIKVIDKMRFPTKQEAALKNEVSILQSLGHPGIVNLEKMFETPERIFVVMDKLKGDMLEMILSSEQGHLSERVTKFLVTQILVALKHLHSKNIVHCDLKPENVLLSSDSDFPQVQLCDFGFARIIGEKGFRKSVVGPPAYLAPEVLRNKGYNRSLDMWSSGVIIYVSLSGTFPFNEDEDTNEQIQNASFMYPPHPWKQISTQAIDLITNLLQVKMRKRYSVDKALMHPWLQDYQTWCDLRDLEKKINVRFLTHESDDGRWENYRQRHLSDVTEKVGGLSM